MRLRVLIVAALVLVASGIGVWARHPYAPIAPGVALLTRGDASGAVRALLPVVTARPSDAEAHYYLGLAYAQLGVREGALNELQEAVQLTPGDARFHDGLGRVYREAGDVRRALVELEHATQADGHDARYQLDLGGLLLDEGRLGDALGHLRRAAQLAPREAEVHLVLAEALRRTGDRDAMVEQYQAARRLAAGSPVGEVARQELRAAEDSGRECR